MGEKASEVIAQIKEVLRDNPSSISDIADKLQINWRTAESYLNLLKELNLVKEKNIKNTRTFFYLEKDNYFDLPVKNKDRKLISSIYALIKSVCQKKYQKEPTKTQLCKILWKIKTKLNLNLPIGWYMYGPFCVQKYYGDEDKTKLPQKTASIVKETTIEYCKLDNIDLQNMIYDEEGESLYITRRKLKDSPSREELNNILMDFIKYSPKEAIDVVTDFSRATLLLGFEETRDCFQNVWKYIAMLRFKESLKKYYGEYIEIYFDERIESIKKEAQLEILNLVRAKHIQEKQH